MENTVIVIKDTEGYIVYSSFLGSDCSAKTTQNLSEATTFDDPKQIEYVLGKFRFNKPVLVEVKLTPVVYNDTQTSKYELFAKLSKQIDKRKLEQEKETKWL